MNAISEPPPTRVAGFRTKLLVAMMLVVSAITGLALYLAQRNLAASVEGDLQREFQAELAALHHVQVIRHAALVERCRTLVRKPRIHAALEDNALDLLYPSAKDELRDVMQADDDASPENAVHALHAKFYRFLDRHGVVISPPNAPDVGVLTPGEEASLALKMVPEKPQLGYLARAVPGTTDASVSEVIAMPIISNETGEVIAALVLGFKPVDLSGQRARVGIKSGIWLDGKLHFSGVADPAQRAIAAEIGRAMAAPLPEESNVRVAIGGVPHLLFRTQLNPDSLFPPADEVCIYPLGELLARQRQLRWQVLGTGALLLLGGLGASHVLSGRLSVPVEKLAALAAR